MGIKNDPETNVQNLSKSDSFVEGLHFAKPPYKFSITKDSTDGWKMWIQQYGWFEKVAGTKNLDQETQVAIFMSCISVEAVKIFNTFQLSSEQQNNIEVVKEKFNSYF